MLICLSINLLHCFPSHNFGVLAEPVETYSDELANKCRALYKQMIQFKADRQEFKEEAAALNEQFDQLATQYGYPLD